jgi:hypothetical protein
MDRQQRLDEMNAIVRGEPLRASGVAVGNFAAPASVAPTMTMWLQISTVAVSLKRR